MSQPDLPPGVAGDPYRAGALPAPAPFGAPWEPVRNFRTHAIVAVVLSPLVGLFAVLKSFDVDARLRAGDVAGAQASSRTARTLSVVAYWVGGAGMLLTLVGTLVVVGFAVADVVGSDPFTSDDANTYDEANAYGDAADLDALWDDCAAGDGSACDDLYWSSPTWSEYEVFGATCGLRTTGGRECTDAVMSRRGDST